MARVCIFGQDTGNIRRFISKLSKEKMAGKGIAVFDTYLGKDYEKAVKNMEKQTSDKIPVMRLLAPGLSVGVERMKGPIAEGELAVCREFGIRLGRVLLAPGNSATGRAE